MDLLKVLVFLTVLGACLSILYWMPQTIQVIETYGIGGAIATTHLIRIFIDLITLVTIWMLAQKIDNTNKEAGNTCSWSNEDSSS